MVMSILKDYNWEPWRFSITVAGFWENPENQRKYMESLAKKINIREQKDWYQISSMHFLENRGKSLLALYNNSPSRFHFVS